MKSPALRVLLALLVVGLSGTLAQAQGPTLDPSFAIVSVVGQRQYALIVDLVRQPDGKLLIAGDFSRVNGRPAFDVCRVLADGQLDTTFAYARTDDQVKSIALQADGRVLVAGDFRTIAGRPFPGVARLFADGRLDTTFRSPYGGNSRIPTQVDKVVVQPGKGILILGGLIPTGSTGVGTAYFVRLLASTGARDTTFRPNFSGFTTSDVLVLPSGRLVIAGGRLFGGQRCNVWATLPDGAIDPSFVPLPSTAGAAGFAYDAATGRIYLAAALPGAAFDVEPVRLLPNGVRDPTFSTAGTFVGGAMVGSVQSIAVQPNGRLLLGGTFPVAGGGYLGSARLLPSGAPDPSYRAVDGPQDGCRRVLVQPDGALVFAGYFSQAGGFALNCLARMRDPNVLGARPPAPDEADGLAAWPVPAHEVLHLRLPAGRRAQQAQLLDALGRVVRRQALPEGQPAPVLPLTGLPPGTYLLRVDFAEGPPAHRRVAVE